MSPRAVLTFCNEFCTLETSRPTPAWSQCRYSARLQCAALPGCLSGWPGSDDQLAHPGETAREGRLGRVLLREGGSSSSSRSSTRVCCRHIGVSEASVKAAEKSCWLRTARGRKGNSPQAAGSCQPQSQDRDRQRAQWSPSLHKDAAQTRGRASDNCTSCISDSGFKSPAACETELVNPGPRLRYEDGFTLSSSGPNDNAL
jgi:hypothetical protein